MSILRSRIVRVAFVALRSTFLAIAILALAEIGVRADVGREPRVDCANHSRSGSDPRENRADDSRSGSDSRADCAVDFRSGSDPRENRANHSRSGSDSRENCANHSRSGSGANSSSDECVANLLQTLIGVGEQRWGRVLCGLDAINAHSSAALVIGIPDGNGTVRAFRRSADSEMLEPAWERHGRPGQALGSSFTSADLDGDGWNDLGIGGIGSARASAVAMVVSGAPQLDRAVLWKATSHESEAFGSAIRVLDFDGDGGLDVVVGASAYNGGETREGRLLAFRGSNGGATEPFWTFESNRLGASLGHALAVVQNVDGHGCNLLLAGGPDASTGSAHGGLVLGFIAGEPSFPSPSLEIRGNSAYGYLGYAICGLGDLDGDGDGDAAVSAPGFDGARGEVLFFAGGTNGLIAEPAWTLRGTEASGWFGVSLAALGDVDSDGYDDLAIGAMGEGSGGRVHLIRGSAQGPMPCGALEGEPGMFFGWSVAAWRDLDQSVLAVGAPWAESGSGSVQVFALEDPFRTTGEPLVNFATHADPVGLGTPVARDGDDSVLRITPNPVRVGERVHVEVEGLCEFALFDASGRCLSVDQPRLGENLVPPNGSGIVAFRAPDRAGVAWLRARGTFGQLTTKLLIVR